MQPFPEIVTIDCDYTRPRFAAAYLVHDSEQAVFIDNNTTHSVPLLLRALDEAGLRPKQVSHLIITHVHLDHAGGSSALMQACPNAILLGHPRATPHVIDPARLVAGARAVYGEETFDRLYGEIAPVPAERVRPVVDGETLPLGDAEFRFFFTRGHANHHLCIELRQGARTAVFTGDAFGLAYPDLQTNGLFVFPSTSPTDFDAVEARLSVQKILATGAQAAYPTHFGAVKDLPEAARQLEAGFDFSEKLLTDARAQIETGASRESVLAECERAVYAWMKHKLESHGLEFDPTTRDLLKLDLDLNAAGIAHVALKPTRV